MTLNNTMLRFPKQVIACLLVVFATGCAKRGNITGGTKDTLAPVLKMSFPKNYSTGFNGREIKLVFDEYVKLKDVKKQLIVSPPMKTAPEILPQTASKTITIKINDTLQPNTTYSFNFGQSIEDNNESNPYPQFKYVFSTGDYIDSLSLRGVIKDAYEKSPDKFVSVMLYEINDKFNDSIVYKENPRYITNTLDSLQTFSLENLKAGKYMLVAMKDLNSNNKFDPKQDKIAFQKEFVSVPNDTLYELELFKEAGAFKAIKPTLASGNRFYMGYTGKPQGVKTILTHGNDIIQTIVTKVPEKDSLNIWYKPVKADSLQLNVTKNGYNEDFILKFKTAKNDSLTFSPKQSGTLPLREEFMLTASRPLVKIDNALIRLTKSDSSVVAFTTAYDEFMQQLKVSFAKAPQEKYKVIMLPGALTDFYDKTNDTLQYELATKNTTDYGNLKLNLQNVRKFPIIVELTDSKGKVLATEYSESASTIQFDALEPQRYTLRIIYDENGNKEWDTGSFLEKRQSEEVIYFPGEIDVRANWDVDQVFKLP
jgi:uncharacterized protein (DUF2141 family)